MSSQHARYDALPSLPLQPLQPDPSAFRYSTAAKGGSSTFSNPTGAHLDNDGTMSDTSYLYQPAEENPYAKPAQYVRTSMMRDYSKEIIGAVLLLLLPLPLSAVLMYLIYANLQPRTQDFGFADSISEENTNRSLSNSDYYVNYSATQLVFISSLSSTLALALVPVAMGLFAYIAAFTLQKASNAGRSSRLPSPYQFELAIRLLGGSFMDLYRYLKYVVLRRGKKLAAVPMLNYSAFALAIMLMLAIAITVVDALLHIGTATVQYHSTIPYVDADFNPGRRLPTSCWNLTEISPYPLDTCNINPGGSGAAVTFANSSDGYLTLGNQSTRNFVRLADDGKTAIITPTTFPTSVQFTAQSYASSTQCETVTKRCKPHYNGVGTCDACQTWAFDCTPEAAGLELSGNFSMVFNTDSGSGSGSSSGHIATLTNFFDTSSKTTNSSGGLAAGHMWTSVLFALPAGTDSSIFGDNYDEQPETITYNMYYDPTKDIVINSYGIVYGILSCNTILSDVTYSMRTDGSIYNATTKAMNLTATSPFYGPLGNGFGTENVGSGINLAAASAKSPKELAYLVARAMDRTILGLSAGILPDREAVTMVKTATKQVAKIPVAEFVALIALNLVLPVVGCVLGAWAWLLCVRHGVRDVQARLGIAALVAGQFEDKKFNETATNVQELYAELRGLPTSRVAVGRRGVGRAQTFVAVAEDDDGIVK